ELAGVLRETLQRINLALDRPPYNLVIHTSPNRDSDHEYYHWHIEIMPKLTKVAGFEWGSGFYINPTPPRTPPSICAKCAIPRRLLDDRSVAHRRRGERSFSARTRWRGGRRPGRARARRGGAWTRSPVVPSGVPRPDVPRGRTPRDRGGRIARS